MREIKFRAKSDKEWVYGMLLRNATDDYGEHGNQRYEYLIQSDTETTYGEYDKYYITDEKTIGQYTGLKDKNGKEIYEGDILIDDEDEIAIVQYSEVDAMFEIILDNIVTNFSNESSEWWRIIGNIYDNPELLKESE